MTRPFWLRLHRYVGLATALFLILVALTGSLLAFLPELNRLTAPQLFPPPQALKPLDQATLALRAEALVPQALVNGVYLGEPGTALVYFGPRTDPETRKPFKLDSNSIFLDPYTGDELGRRKWGDLSAGWVNVMPFIYRLHYNLALDKAGNWILGITAVLWTLDCFVGFFLTLPARRRRQIAGPSAGGAGAGNPQPLVMASALKRWKLAWRVKWRSSAFRTNFDLHRAGGLWLWLALLVFAWSSVFMNLHDEVYAPVTRLFFDYPPRPSEGPRLSKPLQTPALDWRQALQTAEHLMAEQAQQHGFTVNRPVNFWLNRAQGNYHYVVHSSLDFQDRRGRTIVIFDANAGTLKQLLLPSGQHNGSTITHWLQSLHEANVFGMPYRIFVCVLGLAITLLSVTGIYVWWKKRHARNADKQRLLLRGGGDTDAVRQGSRDRLVAQPDPSQWPRAG